jgi:processive 1,2-diacylglycerol beta-glucosyltransferase
LEQENPDLLLSVHPNFNGSVLNIMDKYDISIPFITLIADLVSISPHWVDSRADYIISPTHEAKIKCIKFKYPEEKVKILGFPVRSRFCNNHIDDFDKDNRYKQNLPLKCLIMSGGEGSGNMSKIAYTLLENFNCKVKIIAGRNKAIRKKLKNTLCKKFESKIEVYGFVNNIQDLMIASDIAITRGSPNVMMEAISCNVPLIITGALPGQEQGNPEFALKYNLGVMCINLDDLKKTVGKLLSDNGLKLNQIKKSQRQFANPYTAENIVNFILNLEYNKDISYVGTTTISSGARSNGTEIPSQHPKNYQ